MYLIIGSTPHADWRLLLPLLEQAGCRIVDEEAIQEWRSRIYPSTEVTKETFHEACRKLLDASPNSAVLPVGEDASAKQLAAWVEEFDNTLLLLFHTRPEKVLVTAMAQKQGLDDALDNWLSTADRLLRTKRYHCNRTYMVDVNCALSAPAKFLKACRDHMNLKINVAILGNLDEIQPTNDTTEEIHRLIAAQAVAQSQTAQDLINELEASSLPIGEPAQPPRVDYQEILQKLQQMPDYSGDLQQENELLLLQLHQVQKELESYYFEYQAVTEKNQETKKEKDRLKKHIEKMKQSASWKVTAPLRAIRKPFLKK